MTRVLVVDSRQADFLQINQLVKAATEQLAARYEIQHVDLLTLKALKQRSFDVILLAQSYEHEDSLQLLQKIICLNLPQPILFVSDSADSQVEQQALQFGADDCLPKDELTAKYLDRSIRLSIQRKNHSQEFSRLATHDQLTGLANRYLLYEHLERAISIAKRVEGQFAVLFIDIDKFKLINDSLGHDVGDLLLVQVAERLSECVRETDIVSRFGNDEFAVLLEDSGNSRNLVSIVEKVQQTMEPAFEIRDHELFITTSIGVANYPECGEEPEGLLKSADSALYKAKELGRNKYHFFTDDLNKESRMRLELEKNLRRALINCEFDIYLQPQISKISHNVIGAEALLRWRHPIHGIVSPEVFIPLLEDLGILVGVEGWVLNQVCLYAKPLVDYYGELNFSVNISGSHFKSDSLKENIYMALQSSELDASNLEVELTEDIMIEHVERNSNLLNELKALGVSVALDDFGKGYSSLSYLKNFPADILKLDKAFIDNIVSDKRDAAIVEAMIDLSHKLDIKVVAEGVEDQGQLAKLEAYKCDYIQGYYFAKPMPMSEFTDFVKNRSHIRKSNSQ